MVFERGLSSFEVRPLKACVKLYKFSLCASVHERELPYRLSPSARPLLPRCDSESQLITTVGLLSSVTAFDFQTYPSCYKLRQKVGFDVLTSKPPARAWRPGHTQRRAHIRRSRYTNQRPLILGDESYLCSLLFSRLLYFPVPWRRNPWRRKPVFRKRDRDQSSGSHDARDQSPIPQPDGQQHEQHGKFGRGG